MMDDSITDIMTNYMKLIYEDYDTKKENYLKEFQSILARFEKKSLLVTKGVSLLENRSTLQIMASFSSCCTTRS
ncbi:hypothetical protein AALO_G00193050 [Alosa alosa]|uniref:Uncharacterized protein n=1 Tax=Alosa alosa TaxID=278164 RepID=A0AAV6G6M1_9TELE|nr:hypothetical protein AALO_G00193050 [Alosa alosa]